MATKSPVYDPDSDQRYQPRHDDLGTPPKQASEEVRGLEDQYAAAPAPEHIYEDTGDIDPSTNLKPAEESPEPPKNDSDQVGNGYNSEGGDTSDTILPKKAHGKSKRKKRLLLFGAAAGAMSGLGIIILLFFLMVSLLKIPGLAANITTYQFARMSRQASKAADRVTQEDLAIKAAGDGGEVKVQTKPGKFKWLRLSNVLGALKQKYQNLKDNVWKKLDNALPGNISSYTLLPSKVIKNLQTNNGLEPQWTLSTTGRKILTGIKLNDTVYPIEQVSGITKWTPVLGKLVTLRNQARFVKVGLPALSDSMKANNVGMIVRGITANKIRQQYNIPLIAWVLSKFVNKDAAQASLVEAQERYKAVETPAQEPDNAKTKQIREADKAVKQAEQKTVNSPEELRLAIANNGISPEVIAALKTVNNLTGIASTVAKGLNAVYAIAQPLCIVNDGAVVNSGSSIDNRIAQALATFYYTASAADQQKAGSSDPKTAIALTAAVSATSSAYGNTNLSPPYVRDANNGSYNTTSSLSPQSGSGGSYDYTLLDALGLTSPGSAIGGHINNVVNSLCPVLTNTATAISMGILGILASDGFSEAAGDAAGQGALKFVQTYTKNVIVGALTKKLGEDEAGKLLANNSLPKIAAYLLRSDGKKYLIKNGTIVGFTMGLTEAAHFLVSMRSGVLSSGLNQGTDLSTEADMGGSLAANQLERTQEFGAPLTKPEVASSAAADRQYISYQTSQQSAYTRYLSPNYADSLLVHVATDVGRYYNGSFADAMMSLGNTLLQPLRSFGSLFVSLSGRASAATPIDYNADAYDYGIVQFGWTQAEENLIDSYPDSYSMAANQKFLDASGEEGAIAAKYAICYGYKFTNNGTDIFDPGDSNSEMQLDVTGAGSMGNMLAGQNGVPYIARDNVHGNVVDSKSALCSQENVSYNSTDPLAADHLVVDGQGSPETNDLIFRWRLAMRYDLAADQLIHVQTVTAQ